MLVGVGVDVGAGEKASLLFSPSLVPWSSGRWSVGRVGKRVVEGVSGVTASSGGGKMDDSSGSS